MGNRREEREREAFPLFIAPVGLDPETTEKREESREKWRWRRRTEERWGMDICTHREREREILVVALNELKYGVFV